MSFVVSNIRPARRKSAWFSGIRVWLSTFFARDRARLELETLTDESLKDIGISREEAIGAARDLRWDAPNWMRG